MKKTHIYFFFLSLFFLQGMASLSMAQSQSNPHSLRISMQKRLPGENGSLYVANEIQQWNPAETAIVVCDMWDRHWCNGASERVSEMAPFMNEVISVARQKGVLIVHAPSETMDYYENHPARKLGKRYHSEKAKNLISVEKLASEKEAIWPVDQSGSVCDDFPACKPGPPYPWTRQIDAITMADQDAISDSGEEIGGLFYQKGIKNVVLMGVHTNMCVIGRSFGLRNMVRLGMNVVLMRDLTDTMYDSNQWPNVNHFTGNSLVNEYIETYVSPSIVSTDFTGKKQFRFKADQRPLVAFITAESEYGSNQTLPDFAHELLLTKDINCEFAIGKPSGQGEDRHNIENLQILEDADLAVLYVRRRGLEASKMKFIKNYINSGKPILGIRTASHAFDPRMEEGDNKDDSFLNGLAKWPEFDAEIFGGNYQGHFSNNLVAEISAVPGMEDHPLLNAVSMEDFTSSDGLYRNRFLSSDKAQVILFGTITGEPLQPVLWTNDTGKNNVIYSSLGSVNDWKKESFRQIMRNAVEYLLDSN